MFSAELPPLHGTRVLLRQPVSADVAARLEVPPDPEAHLMYGGSGSPKRISRVEIASIFEQYGLQDLQRARRLVIAARMWPDGREADLPDGRCIGEIRLHSLMESDRKARLAIGIFDRRFWSLGYGTEAIRLLLQHAFETLSLHRIDLRVLAYNTRAIRAYEKCGFVREGVERESAFVNGVWHDDLMMAVLEDEYRSEQLRGVTER